MTNFLTTSSDKGLFFDDRIVPAKTIFRTISGTGLTVSDTLVRPARTITTTGLTLSDSIHLKTNYSELLDTALFLSDIGLFDSIANSKALVALDYDGNPLFSLVLLSNGAYIPTGVSGPADTSTGLLTHNVWISDTL